MLCYVKRYSSSLRATGRHVTCRMDQITYEICGHPTKVNVPRLTPARKAGTRFTYPGGMEGKAELT